MNIALQLYTLRHECEKDFFATLEAVAKLGYQGLEFAGFFGVQAMDLKKKLDQLELKALAAHVPLESLRENLDEEISFHRAIGNTNIVCPYTRWETEEEFYGIVNSLKEIGGRLKNEGMTFSYHNHAHEFDRIKSHYYLDEIMHASMDIQMELDTYWVKYAGVEEKAYMNQYKERLSLVHIKDMELVDGERRPCALGDGSMDIMAIVEKAEEIGLSWVIVENDDPKPDGLSNVKKSIDYLRRKL
jgi:sugar phosphate isomerase/epimerase